MSPNVNSLTPRRPEERCRQGSHRVQRWRRRLLHPGVEKTRLGRGAPHPLRLVRRRPGQDGAPPQQHLRGQAAGQEASHPHADGDRGALLHLLDAAVLGQHLEGLWPEVGLQSPHRSAHLLHPPAVLHLGLRQPHHLLLHEHALPQGPAVHLCLLLPQPALSPLPLGKEEGGGRGRHHRHLDGHVDGDLHVQVQLHHRQHHRHLLSWVVASVSVGKRSLCAPSVFLFFFFCFSHLYMSHALSNITRPFFFFFFFFFFFLKRSPSNSVCMVAECESGWGGRRRFSSGDILSSSPPV